MSRGDGMIFVFIIMLFILLAIGMPIGFVLIFVGSAGILFEAGYSTFESILTATVYRSVNNFNFIAIPLFILMAHFISKSKIADDLFDSLSKWVGHTSGGVGIATVFANGGFGALTGSSVAANSVMSQIAVPKMIEARYPKTISSGLVASTSGTLAALIPPSIPLILYGVQTENSVGKLLIAGIIPALVLILLLSIFIIFMGIKNKVHTVKYTWKERFLSLKYIWPAFLLILIVVFIVYFGVATPSEAAAFGAFGALILGLSIRRLNFKQIVESLMITVEQTAMIFIIIIGAHVVSYYVALTRVSNDLLDAISASGLSPMAVLFLIILMYLIVGMFLDLIGSMLLTLPLVYPLIIGLGFDPIWFGIVLVIILEIGLVTPPVGLNLFVTSQHTGIPVSTVFRGTLPFIGILLLTVGILILFPDIVLFLPSLM